MSASCSSVTPRLLRKSSPSVHWLKMNLMSKADLVAALSAAILSSVKPLARERRRVDAGRLVEGAVADRIGLDLGDLALASSRACAAPAARRG